MCAPVLLNSLFAWAQVCQKWTDAGGEGKLPVATTNVEGGIFALKQHMLLPQQTFVDVQTLARASRCAVMELNYHALRKAVHLGQGRTIGQCSVRSSIAELMAVAGESSTSWATFQQRYELLLHRRWLSKEELSG